MMLETKKSWTRVQQQYFCSFTVNLISIAHGSLTGWTAPVLPILMSENTPLTSGPLAASSPEISWIGSINCIGALIGSLGSGFLTTQLGAKISLLWLSVPIIANWLLIYFGNSVYHILLARFLGGISGGGIQSGVILFISDVVNDDIRGRLGSVAPVFRNFGTLIGYVLGASVGYKYVPLISVIFPLTFLVIFSIIPNTPRYYLKRGKVENAENALKFYKGYKDNNQDDKNAFRVEFDRLKSIVNEQKEDEKFRFADFLNRAALKGLGIGFALVTLSTLTATFIITAYAVTIFQALGTTIDAYVSSILCAIALIFGAIITTYLADKLGRKKLNLISLSGTACGLLMAALYHYLNKNGLDLTSFAWIAVFSLCFSIIISAAGIVPLAMVCSVENLPSKVRTVGMGMISCWFALTSFISGKTFPFLMESVGLHGCLIIYAIGCIIGSIFVLFVLKETTGSSLDDDLNNTKKANSLANNTL